MRTVKPDFNPPPKQAPRREDARNAQAGTGPIVDRKQILLVFFLLLILILLFSPALSNVASGSLLIHSMFLFIGGYSVVALLRECRSAPYSCRTIHWIFTFFFFFVAPYLQYLYQTWPLDYVPTDASLIRANLWIILWILVFDASKSVLFHNGSIVWGRKAWESAMEDLKGRARKQTGGRPERVTPSNTFMTVLYFTSIFFLFILIRRSGFLELISSRSTGGKVYTADTQAMTSIFTSVVRYTIAYTAFYCCYRYRKGQESLSMLIFSLILLLIGCSPIAMPRFQAASIYITVILLLAPDLKRDISFVILFVVMFMLAFPALNAFRNNSLSSVNLGELVIRVVENYQNEYLTANYDAYTMLMKTDDYVAQFGCRNGMQLIGALFFFIPRSIWTTKPVSTGTMVQEAFSAHISTYNVSSCMVCEGLVDFGVLGIVIYAFAFSLICSWVDLRLRCREFIDSFDGIVYLLLPPFFFFLLRGSLMSVWAFIVACVVIGVFFRKLAKQL